MRALAISRLTLTRFLRDRSNLFFVFIFPLALVMLIGLSFGGSQDHHVEVVAPDRAAVAATAVSIAAQVTGQPPENIERHIGTVTSRVNAVEVEQVAVDGDSVSQQVTDLGRFDLAATTQLILFVFITSLATSSTLVRDRELGVITRMISTPTHTRDIIVGTAAGRLGVALFQGVYIMVGALLLFGVEWGHPIGAVAVLTTFSAVSAAAGLLLGSLAHNEAQASGLAIGVGLGLAALGGSMAPLDVFPDTMRRVAHITPHAWANDAFADLVRHGANPSAIVPELAVLTAMAATLLTAAIWQLRSTTIGQP